MNTKTLCVLFAVVLAAGCLSAQTVGRNIRANVPFGFVAGDVSFPAGTCELYRLLPNLIVVDGGKGQKKAAMSTIPKIGDGSSLGRAKLVFNKYGESYFLAEVWDATEAGQALPKSRKEKDMALIAARQASRVTLAASIGR